MCYFLYQSTMRVRACVIQITVARKVDDLVFRSGLHHLWQHLGNRIGGEQRDAASVSTACPAHTFT
jgi:hypothetical protein